MDALDQSEELLLCCDTLRARSARIRAETDERIEESWRLIAAAAEAREAVMRAHGWKAAGRRARATAGDVPAGR